MKNQLKKKTLKVISKRVEKFIDKQSFSILD